MKMLAIFLKYHMKNDYLLNTLKKKKKKTHNFDICYVVVHIDFHYLSLNYIIKLDLLEKLNEIVIYSFWLYWFMYLKI